MQTTLRINDAIFREAKAEAAREGMTLTRFLEEALTFRLRAGHREKASARMALPAFDSGTRLPKSYHLATAIRSAEAEEEGKMRTSFLRTLPNPASPEPKRRV
jgi:hypothetical protein